jgi:uncharacterized Rossmann fold enzyme
MRHARVFVAGQDAPEDISGADVVVVGADAQDDLIEAIRVRAPNSVVIVVGESPQRLCEGTLFPRSRIIGVAADDEADIVVDAVVNDLDKEVDAIVRCQGERGIEDEFVRVPVRVGARGISEIVEN